MAIHAGTTMSQEDKDQRKQTLAKTTDYMLNTQIRGEQLEERMLDEMLEEARKENLQTLETEWADYASVWQPMIQEEGKTPREALDFLMSFA